MGPGMGSDPARCPSYSVSYSDSQRDSGQVPAYREGETKGEEGEPPCSGQRQGQGFTQSSTTHFLLGSVRAGPEIRLTPRPGAQQKGRGLGLVARTPLLPPPES